MSEAMRQERGDLAVEWIKDGAHQEEALGGEELLSCSFFWQSNNGWLPIEDGKVATQVRAGEEEEVLRVLLEKLLDRLEPFVSAAKINENATVTLPGSEEALEKLRWFGPEMAEEY
jgi:hypothetical protein